MRAKRVVAGMTMGVLMSAVCAQTTRTPDGVLWAGTTLSLRAVASDSAGQPIALSNEAQVRVGQIVRWQWEYESPPYLTVPSWEGWFTMFVRNKGNGVDALRLKTATSEGADTSPWQVSLYEQLDASQLFGNATPINENTAPFMPSESRRLFINVRPPSNRNTDGVFLTLKMASVTNSQPLTPAEFVAGAESRVSAHTSFSSWANYPLASPPQLLNGRLFWVIANGSDMRFFSTPQPLNAESTFQNNTRYEAKLVGMMPAGQGTVVGNYWYLTSTIGFIAYFDWTQATGGVTASMQWLPTGELVANPNLPLISDGANLYFALTSQHIGVYTPASNALNTVLVTNPSPIVQMQMLPNSVLFVGREDGRFDLVWRGILLESGMVFSGSGSITGAALDERRGTLLIARGARIGCYRPLQRQWLWTANTHAPLISPPAYSPDTDSVYALTRDGWLYAFDASAGSPRPFYPQPIITDAPVAKANLSVLARSDRKVPYIYLAAQLDLGGALTTRVLQITTVNPFNRFYSTSVVDGAVLGDGLLFTGAGASDLMLVWCRSGGEGNRGRFYGFRLR